MLTNLGIMESSLPPYTSHRFQLPHNSAEVYPDK
jgi:hypothetical protein